MSPLILICDDYPDARDMYGSYLAHAGYRVVSASDGVDAVAKSRHLRPDVVVLDLLMPRMDGIEAIRQLKLEPSTKQIPVLALTGAMTGQIAERAMDAGCDEFITKPCLPTRLLEHIERYLSVAKRPEAADSRGSNDSGVTGTAGDGKNKKRRQH